jgi:sigma-B regulation protein RsbU (phosphoserine phosphatase)
LHPGGKFETLSKSHGLPLGIYRNKSYKHSNIRIEPGDILLLFTDGVTNAQNREKKFFGTEKLESILERMPDCSAETLIDDLTHTLKAYETSGIQADDITLMAVKYFPQQKSQA